MRQSTLAFTLFFFLVAFPLGISQTTRQLQVRSIQSNDRLLLTQALRIVGLHVKEGFVSFGVDINGESEPTVDINMPDTTLDDALQRITSQIPGYASEFVSSHVVEIYPSKERANAADPLNLPIREFSVKDIPAMTIFSSPARYVPDLKTYLSKDHNNNRKDNSELGYGHFVSEMKSDAPGVTLFLTSLTVRQILDAVAEADAALPVLTSSQRARPYPVGWVHKRKNDATFGIVDTWSSMSFAPHDWKLYARRK